MVKRFVSAFFLGFGAIFVMYFLNVFLPQFLVTNLAPGISGKTNTVLEIVPTPTPTPSPGLTPVTMIIPKLKIQTAVESVGLTETNNMDTPKNAANVAWYGFGAKPGEEGNAVIAGHYDTPTGKPAIFYNLRKLSTGDEIEVISENGVHSIFVVSETSSIPYDIFPSEQVFKTKPGKNLNLITCGGIWDATKKTYTNRLVVYTTLKEVDEVQKEATQSSKLENL